jgi:hypothetical protein
MSGRIFCTRRGRVRSMVSWRDSDTGMQLGFKSLEGRKRRGEERKRRREGRKIGVK